MISFWHPLLAFFYPISKTKSINYIFFLKILMLQGLLLAFAIIFNQNQSFFSKLINNQYSFLLELNF